jgi:hypothetical protein
MLGFSIAAFLASASSLAGVRSDEPWTVAWSGESQIVQGTVTKVYFTDSFFVNIVVQPLGASEGAEVTLRFGGGTSASPTAPQPGDYIVASGLRPSDQDANYLHLYDMFQSISTSSGPVMADRDRRPIARIHCESGAERVPRVKATDKDGYPLLPIENTQPAADKDPALLSTAIAWSAGVEAIHHCLPQVSSWSGGEK